MWLGSGGAVAVAVAQASGYSSHLTPSLGTFICQGRGPKKKDKKKKSIPRNVRHGANQNPLTQMKVA